MAERNVYFQRSELGALGFAPVIPALSPPHFLNKLPNTPLTTLSLHLTLDYSVLFFPKPPVNNREARGKGA